MSLYTNFASSFILWDVVLLTAIAYSIYFRPGGLGFLGRLRSIFFRWPHGYVLLGFILYTFYTDAYLIIASPYSIQLIESLGGVITTSTSFQPYFLVLSVADLIFFFGYPSSLLILAAGGSKDRDVRRALIILPVCWTGIGLDLLIVNGFLISIGFDFIYLGYVLAAAVFAITASVFRRASLLSSFFEPVRRLLPATSPFSGRISRGVTFDGTESLLEVDSSSDYEEVVRDFAVEQNSHGSLVFVFTSRGSPVYNTLSLLEGVRFYLLTSKVSYPKPTELANEILAPQNDHAVLLDLLDKTVTSTAGSRVSVIFDSISDLILYSGFESCYKFIKQANEILSSPQVSSLFLVTSGAHEEKIINLMRGLYANHVVYDNIGLKLTRGGRAVET